jgi:hypothetical protein
MVEHRLEITSNELEKQFGVRRFTYSLSQLSQLAKTFKDNHLRIASTYVVAREFIWPQGEPEFIIEFIEDLDHLRRGEPTRHLCKVPEEWIVELSKILCPQKTQ